MKLVSDSQFDIRQYYGNLVILYPEKREELIAPLRQRLDVSGHVYYCCPVGPLLLARGDAFEDILALLDRCVCLVPVMTPDLVSEANSVSRAMFWHFIGYMKAKIYESVVPYIPSVNGEKLDLRGTPLQGIDIMFDADTFIQKIPAKYGTKLLCYNYYENKTTNLYASRRINFRCLTLRFQIYEKAFQNAREYYNDYTGFNRSDSEFDRYIEEKIICGCRVVSFGTETRLEPQMMVYKDEVHPYITDYPKALSGKKEYRRLTEAERKSTGIRAELTMEVLIPVHKLLGAYIKCYLSCLDDDSSPSVLLALMQGDFCEGRVSELDFDSFDSDKFWEETYPEEIFVDRKTDRLYFSFNFKSDQEPLSADENLRVGKTLDYIFPQ